LCQFTVLESDRRGALGKELVLHLFDHSTRKPDEPGEVFMHGPDTVQGIKPTDAALHAGLRCIERGQQRRVVREDVAANPGLGIFQARTKCLQLMKHGIGFARAFAGLRKSCICAIRGINHQQEQHQNPTVQPAQQNPVAFAVTFCLAGLLHALQAV
jgi:hypothetical protein